MFSTIFMDSNFYSLANGAGGQMNMNVILWIFSGSPDLEWLYRIQIQNTARNSLCNSEDGSQK